MHLSPSVLGAVAAVLVTGVACGAELGTVPDFDQPAAVETLPQADAAQIAWHAPSAQATPDHYPIVTPEGRFEVSQLSDRGLYSTPRYAAVMAYSRAVDAPPEYAPAPVAPAAAAASDRRVVVYDASEGPDAAAPAQPQLADAPGARVINVAAELAAQKEPAHDAQAAQLQ